MSNEQVSQFFFKLSTPQKNLLRDRLKQDDFENPARLGVDKGWNPFAVVKVSNGKSICAKEHAITLVQSRGDQLLPFSAMERTMIEYPDAFPAFKSKIPEQWIQRHSCEGSFARERAIDLIEREGYSALKAVNCVMFEYPNIFFEDVPKNWDNKTQCGKDNVTAMKVGKVMIKNSDLNALECIEKIMSDHQESFDYLQEKGQGVQTSRCA